MIFSPRVTSSGGDRGTCSVCVDDMTVGLISIFEIRSEATADESTWLGYGIINADGDLWKTQRKAGQRFFSPANLKSLVDVVLPLHLADTKSYLIQRAADRKLVDLQHVFLDFTTRLMGKLAYDVGSKHFSLRSHSHGYWLSLLHWS